MRQNYKKKANYKDSFEDLVLRHDYLRKIEEHDLEGMEKYEKIVKITARIMYNKHYLTYNKVSYYYEDIVNITRSYLAGSLGIYGFKNQPMKLLEFQASFHEKNGRYPTQEEVDRKERNNIINFLRQRLGTCKIFCERKSRNIVVGKGERVFFAHTAMAVPASDDAILENPELFGYRTLTSKEVEAIKDKKNLENEVDSKGFKIIAIERHSQIPVSLFVSKSAGEVDGDSINEIIHERLTPSVEESIMDVEEDIQLSAMKDKFDNFTDKNKEQVLKNFINQNKKNPYLTSEISAARKILKTLTNVV